MKIFVIDCLVYIGICAALSAGAHLTIGAATTTASTLSPAHP